MRYLVIGASGQIGEQLIQNILNRKEEVIGTYYKTPISGWNNLNNYINKIPSCKIFTLDITRQADVENVIADIRPDVIFIPAANTRVDYCDEEPELTYLTNVQGVKNVIKSIHNIKENNHSKIEPLIVYFSSDYIFDGRGGPYDENDLANPQCEYGKQKLLAEHYIATVAKHSLIFRTSGVFGPESQGKNFVLRLVKNLSENKEANVPCDEFGTPTYSPDLAEAALKIVNNIGSNFKCFTSHVINIAGPETITRYEFAKDIAKSFGYDTDLIKPVYSKDIIREAKRPLKAGLSTNKLENLIGRKLISYREAFKKMIKLK